MKKKIIHKRAVQKLSYALCTGSQVDENRVSGKNAKVTCKKCLASKEKTQSYISYISMALRLNGGCYS